MNKNAQAEMINTSTRTTKMLDAIGLYNNGDLILIILSGRTPIKLLTLIRQNKAAISMTNRKQYSLWLHGNLLFQSQKHLSFPPIKVNPLFLHDAKQRLSSVEQVPDQ